MRNRLTIAALVALLWALTGLGGASGAIDGNPVIESPEAADALYEGYTGPFVVDFTPAPAGTYTYAVYSDTDGTRMVAGPYHYTWSGVGANPQLKVAALPADAHLRFRISDGAGHTAELAFAVRAGQAPYCGLVVPSRVHVRAPKVSVPGRLNSVCARLDTRTADWKVTRGSQVFDYYRFASNTTDTWTVFDSDPVGTYTILPLSARDGDNDAVPQNRPSVVVRRDSRLGFSGVRSGTRVTLRASLGKYSASTNAFVPWADRYVAFAFRTCTSCSWQSLRSVRTDARGVAVGTFTMPSPRYFRIRSSGTSAIWAAPPRYLRK